MALPPLFAVVLALCDAFMESVSRLEMLLSLLGMPWPSFTVFGSGALAGSQVMPRWIKTRPSPSLVGGGVHRVAG